MANDSARAKLVSSLESVCAFFESSPRHVGSSGFLSPQEPGEAIGTALWHLRRGKVIGLHYAYLMLLDDGPLHRLMSANEQEPQFLGAQATFLANFPQLHRIRYSGTETPVELGDRVQTTFFFKAVTGRVTYIPGAPSHRPDIDHGGLCHVGIEVPGRAFVASLVDPETLELKKSVKFLGRDSVNVPPLDAEEIEFDN
jgi:hypothetical protein